MSGSLFLGVDGGGTKTHAVLADDHGRVLSVSLDGRTRGLHVRIDDVERVRTAIAGYERLWEIVNALTACEVADLRREARDRRRARQQRREA